jgi:catechol 2,3-dioxygenase-like lactoylglutathione lyase family enzyme
MLRGLTTVSLWAADLAAAKKWYAELLGIDPYFERPGYAEFRLGDYQHELGLIDSRYAPHGSATGPAGAVVYWLRRRCDSNSRADREGHRGTPGCGQIAVKASIGRRAWETRIDKRRHGGGVVAKGWTLQNEAWRI